MMANQDQDQGQLEWRLAVESDANQVVSLVNSAYRGDSGRQGWTTESDFLDGQRLDLEMYKELIQKENCFILVFIENCNQIVACVNVEIIVKEGEKNFAYIGMVTVNPLKQSNGLGSFVLKTAEIYAKSNYSCTTAKMTIIQQRAALIKFYEKKGYVNTGIKEPFPTDTKFGIPKVPDLAFDVFVKTL